MRLLGLVIPQGIIINKGICIAVGAGDAICVDSFYFLRPVSHGEEDDEAEEKAYDPVFAAFLSNAVELFI